MFIEVVDAGVTTELRRSVLRPAWAVDTPMHGNDDPAAVHIAARPELGGPVIGAAVLLPKPYPLRLEVPDAWQLRGMATHPDWRHQGVGHEVLLRALSEVSARGARFVWCHAREGAIGFYARYGFIAEGERFDHAETGIVHQHMWRRVREPLG